MKQKPHGGHYFSLKNRRCVCANILKSRRKKENTKRLFLFKNDKNKRYVI